MGKHTPGPWRLCAHLKDKERDQKCGCGFPGDIWGPDGEHVICGIGPHCVEGSNMIPRYGRKTELANARLIVAAPDLLDALKYLVKVPSRLSGEQLAVASKAIAQAEKE